MNETKALQRVHPQGEAEQQQGGEDQPAATGETFGGKVGLRWDEEAAVTAFGQWPYFVEFLKTAGLFEAWGKDCPLTYSSPHAPDKREGLATLLLSVLAGQRRDAHIDALRADTLAPTLLGVGKLVSEDSARRAFKHVDEEACQDWLERHLKRSYEELLEEDWIFDVDATVKPLYGRQEGARLGYNPAKPGRPSHVYHSYMAANIRLLLGVEVQPGNQTAPSYAPPRLGAFWDERKPDRQPKLLRGDAHGGTEQAMLGAEQRSLDYLFRLRQTTGVKRLIARLFASDDWARRTRLARRARRVAVARLEPQPKSDRMAATSSRLIGLRRERGATAAAAIVGTDRSSRRRHLVRVRRTGDVARGEAGSDRAVVPRPRRRGEQLRRTEEPIGLDGLHDARLEAQPSDGGRDGAGLQRVGIVHAVDGGGPGRSDHDAAAAVARPCAAYPARASDDADDHELARQGAPEADGIGDGQRVSQARVAATAEQLGSPTRWRLILSWIFRDFLDGRVAGTDFRLADCLA